VPSFAKLYFRAFVRPRRALEAVLAERRRLRYGGYAVAITALSYQLVHFFLGGVLVYSLIFALFNR
jgi:hypothetical protein